MRFFQPYFKQDNQQDQESGLRPGYYLVLPASNKKIFISVVVDREKLYTMLEDTDEDWWIDRSLGKDVDGKPAWCNSDFSNRFVD